jgi:hypothetical protein
MMGLRSSHAAAREFHVDKKAKTPKKPKTAKAKPAKTV